MTTTDIELSWAPPVMTGCFDADNHMREPIDAFPAYMERAFRERGWRVGSDGEGRRVLLVGESESLGHFSNDPPRPGSFRANLLRLRQGELIDPFLGDTIPSQPEFWDRDARLDAMDAQGLEAALIFGSIAVSGEWMLDERDLPQTYANLRAVNRYFAERWGWSYKGRIFTVAMMSLVDLELGLRELERLIAEGVRLVNLVPGVIGTRSPADPYFDPFWARVQDAGLLVTFHTSPASNASYRKMFAGFWEPFETVHSGIASGTTSAFMGFQSFNERPIMDTVSALVLHNLFGRFPGVKVLSVENGTFWVPFTVKLMNKNYAINQNGFWLGGKPERPSSVFRRHVFVTPFHEENIQTIVDAVGADCVLFGSDFPHAEGLAHPVNDFLEDLEITDPAVVDKIMRENLRGLLTPA
jgi:predicted TIM-barrel fold metal-dependent hydrolase